MSDVLWKYECFDEYTGEGWTSNAGTNIYDFYSYDILVPNLFLTGVVVAITLLHHYDMGKKIQDRHINK